MTFYGISKSDQPFVRGKYWSAQLNSALGWPPNPPNGGLFHATAAPYRDCAGAGSCGERRVKIKKKRTLNKKASAHSAPPPPREARHYQQRNPSPLLPSGRRQVSAYFAPRLKHAQVRVRVPICGRLVSCVVGRSVSDVTRHQPRATSPLLKVRLG